MGKLVLEHRFLLVLDLGAVAYLVFRRKHLLYPLYLLVAAAAVSVSVGHPAANYNHLLHVLPPLCLLFGPLLGELWELRQWPVARVVLLLSWAILCWQVLVLSEPDTWYHGLPTPERGVRLEGIRGFLATKSEPILSENVGILLLSGHPVEYDDPWMFSSLARSGVWDDRVLAEKISAQYYNWVVLEYDIADLTGAVRWSPRVFQALKENYDVLYRDRLYIYNPRAR